MKHHFKRPVSNAAKAKWNVFLLYFEAELRKKEILTSPLHIERMILALTQHQETPEESVFLTTAGTSHYH